VQVAYGFDRVVQAIASEPGDSALDEVTEAWTVENQSSGGFGALLPARERDWLAVGRLVAAKPIGPGAWSVGVVRRVSARNPVHRLVGVQILARAGVVVELAAMPGTDGPGAFEAILLPGATQIAIADGEVKLAVPKGRSAQLADCEMRVQQRTYRLVRRGIETSGEDFEIARFGAGRDEG
jgi:hypothetical protein